MSLKDEIQGFVDVINARDEAAAELVRRRAAYAKKAGRELADFIKSTVSELGIKDLYTYEIMDNADVPKTITVVAKLGTRFIPNGFWDVPLLPSANQFVISELLIEEAIRNGLRTLAYPNGQNPDK